MTNGPPFRAFLAVLAALVTGFNGSTMAVETSSILLDVQLFNASCYPKDSCRQDKLSRISDSPDWEKRNCLCDDLCTTFGDCCADSKQFDAEQQKAATSRFSCTALRQYNYNWIVNTCPAAWGDEDSRKGCEDEPTELQIHQDPISFMPVTSLSSGITYRNVKCAICHIDTPGSNADGVKQLRFWNPRLECNSILAGNTLVNQASQESIASKVEWDSEQKMWGLRMDVAGRGEEFHSCFVDPSLPEDLQHLLRSCQPSVSDCPSNWTDTDVSDKCLSYTSYVYHPDTIFRNAHCAICNGVRLNELSCNSTGVSFRQLPLLRDFNPSAFALLFDLKDNDGSGTVGEQISCQEGQLYDPFTRRCRQVYCSAKGQVFRAGRCLDIVPEKSTTLSSNIEGISTTTSSTTSATSSVASSNESTKTPTLTSTTTEASATEGAVIFPDDNDFDLTGVLYFPVEESPSTTTSKTTEKHTTTEMNLKPKQIQTPQSVSNSNQSNTIPTTESSLEEKESKTNESSWFELCPKFLLVDSEVEWLENGTLYVVSRDEMLEEGQFRRLANGGGVLICAEGLVSVSKFGPVLGWVTVAGLGLSEVCLVLHLIAFFISPELRNLSGRNLASLSFALFAAYGSFMLAQFIPSGDALCLGVAVSTYYFFLCSFWWTSVLAWDVWRTIRMATVQLRSSSGHQWGRFALYSLYAWIVPALMVTGTLLIELMDTAPTPWIPAEYHPAFGRNVCWFGQRRAILVFFAAPLLCILSVNLFLFISSAYMIRSTTSKSPTSSNQNGTKKQLGLYIRLALIMGLSWIAGLIAGAADVTPLWYVFVGLCSLQGVFILLAYTCNPKVSRSIRNRIQFFPSKRVAYRTNYRTNLTGGIKSDQMRRLGLESRDSHDSQASNVSQASQTSQTSLTKSSSNSTTSPLVS